MGHTYRAVHCIHGGAGAGLPLRQHLYPRALQGRTRSRCHSASQRSQRPKNHRHLSVSCAGGSFYWIPLRCATRGWTLERSATVSKHVSWENQVAEANQQRNEAEELMRRPAPEYNAPAQAQMPQQPAVKEQCVLLNERVAMLDSMGRAGSRYYDLDWVRSERKKARDEQFRLRC